LVSWGFLSQGSAVRPFSEVSPVWASGRYLEGDEVPGARDLVEAKASDTGDLRIDPRVVVTEEADARAGASDELVEPTCLAHVARTLAVTLEADASRGIVDEQNVDVVTVREGLDLIGCVVTLGVSAKPGGRPFVVRRTEAPSDTANAYGAGGSLECPHATVSKVEEVRENLVGFPRVEPLEVLVVPLDEDGLPRSRALLPPPPREVTGAVVPACGLVDAIRGGPDAEVADVEDPIELEARCCFEPKDIVEEAIECPMYVSRSAEEHGGKVPAMASQ